MAITVVKKEGIIEAPIGTVYQVIADVERYPEYLPDVESVTREGNVVTMSVRLGPMLVTWRQAARFEPNTAISVRLLSGPFKVMNVEWRFEEVPGGTRVTNETQFELKLPIPGIDGLVGNALRANIERTIDAFRERIRSRTPASA
ncbi:MAG: SRPBCC family protein [Chloroflexi bacterium]|nr:SRPBCC family protein [Chloroflexota bacterium]